MTSRQHFQFLNGARPIHTEPHSINAFRMFSTGRDYRRVFFGRKRFTSHLLRADVKYAFQSTWRPLNPNKMNILKVGSQPSSKGPADWFTGTVRIDSPFKGTDPARVTGAIVSFEPGARTAWHTHPLGQTLIVTAGCGWVQRWGGPVEEVRPGDIVWFPPGEKHWHGAAPSTAMTHIAIQEQLDGKAVDWMEKVSDEQYRR
jgi:quercetin dioxygenase-like cupin family protein